MAKKYYVFLIPFKHHATIRKVINNPIRENISDEDGDVHHVKITLNEDNKNIIVDNDTSEIILCYEDHCEIGLYLYSYENCDNSSFLKDKIPNAIYHMIKGFYHVHEHHDNNADSVLKNALESDEYINIKSVNNEAFCYYVNIYEEKFNSYFQQLNVLWEELDRRSKIKHEKGKLLDRYKNLIGFCHKALGELLYCNTLLNSQYINESGAGKDLKMQVFNIKNTIDNIKLIEAKCQMEFNYKSTLISFKDSFRYFIISTILAIIGVILAVLSIFPVHK